MKKMSSLLMAIVLVAACSSSDPNQKTKRGAGIGAAAGAVAGAIIGNRSGNPAQGAVIGAAVGAGVGATVGRRMDKQQEELQQIEGVEVQRTSDNELNVVLRNDVLFDVDSSSLRSDSRSTLRDMAGVFSRYNDTQISVEGHADSNGEERYNQNLSERRAGTVRDYLVDQGVSSSRIDARGFGESQPKSSNSTPDGRQTNRRVEIRVRAAS
ncbi:MAG TPA: OmpA family protein [Thermoanaerobaculia bacterium]|nr:OmpA family protein [Thermoanaerobaculia bacterium]